VAKIVKVPTDSVHWFQLRTSPDSANPALAVTNAQSLPNYLMLSSTENANGKNGCYPDGFNQDEKVLVSVGPDRAAIEQELTGKALDTVLDLLVLNQGHGDHHLFSTHQWTGEHLKNHIVIPLMRRNIKANIIVLDFCLSASVLPAFTDLCTDNGRIIGNLYSTTSIIVDTAMWDTTIADLKSRNSGNVFNHLLQRMKKMTALSTGLSNDEPIRRQLNEQAIKELLKNATPLTKEIVSIIRYLHKIYDIYDEQEQNAAQRQRAIDYQKAHRELKKIKDNTDGNVGDKEMAILDPFPNTSSGFNQPQYDSIKAKLKNRLIVVATEQQYGIGESRDLAQMPLFLWQASESNSIGSIVWKNSAQILAQATGLPICPSCFSIYSKSTNSLELDEELANDPLPDKTGISLASVEPLAPEDVPQTLDEIRHIQGITLKKTANFLQNQ
jgi:hypothetical protein